MSPSASTVSYTALKPPYYIEVHFYSVHRKKLVMTFDCAGHLCHMLAGGADVMVWQSVCLYRLSLLYSQGPPTGCTDICGSSKAHPALIPLWWAVCSCSLPCVRGLKVTVKIPAVPRICHIRWPLFLCLQCTSPQLEDLHSWACHSDAADGSVEKEVYTSGTSSTATRRKDLKVCQRSAVG